MIQFHISTGAKKFEKEITYILSLWAKYQGIDVRVSDTYSAGCVAIGPESENHIRTTNELGTTFPQKWKSDGYLACHTGENDYPATAFHLVNSTQEFDGAERDELGRFPYLKSIQFRQGFVHHNKVAECFDAISKAAGLLPHRERSSFFLSHDIDLVNGAYIEDGFHVLKHGRIDLFLAMLFRLVTQRPDWLNMDLIMKLESEYDCKSIFFWIVNRGTVNAREVNADYSFKASNIRKNFDRVTQNGFENGIHKSLAPENFDQEFKKYGSLPFANRYHYLKFNLPQAYHDIENAKLKLDSSVGFAEEPGFRNSYGLPFNPFNFKTRKAFDFVEAPLHVMDRTYFQYKKFSPAEATKDIMSFFEKNKSNCVISVLWHNNFFTDYKFKGYLALYKKILAYIKDNQLHSITAEEIVKKYSIAK
jgi:hypothetical protein